MEQINSYGASVVNKRVYRSEEEILKHLNDQKESGFIPKEYAEMYDINEATFYSRIKKYRKGLEV